MLHEKTTPSAELMPHATSARIAKVTWDLSCAKTSEAEFSQLCVSVQSRQEKHSSKNPMLYFVSLRLPFGPAASPSYRAFDVFTNKEEQNAERAQIFREYIRDCKQYDCLDRTEEWMSLQGQYRRLEALQARKNKYLLKQLFRKSRPGSPKSEI